MAGAKNPHAKTIKVLDRHIALLEKDPFHIKKVEPYLETIKANIVGAKEPPGLPAKFVELEQAVKKAKDKVDKIADDLLSKLEKNPGSVYAFAEKIPTILSMPLPQKKMEALKGAIESASEHHVTALLSKIKKEPGRVGEVEELLPKIQNLPITEKKEAELMRTIEGAKFINSLSALSLPKGAQQHVSPIVGHLWNLELEEQELMKTSENLLDALNKDMCTGEVTHEKLDRTKAVLKAVEQVYVFHGLSTGRTLQRFRKIIDIAEESCQ